MIPFYLYVLIPYFSVGLGFVLCAYVSDLYFRSEFEFTDWLVGFVAWPVLVAATVFGWCE